MSLTREDAWRARYWSSKFFKERSTYDCINDEHLPVNMNIREAVPDVSDKDWNKIMTLMSSAIKAQPFGEPYLWQSHDKNDFARWLRSWRV